MISATTTPVSSGSSDTPKGTGAGALACSATKVGAGAPKLSGAGAATTADTKIAAAAPKLSGCGQPSADGQSSEVSGTANAIGAGALVVACAKSMRATPRLTGAGLLGAGEFIPTANIRRFVKFTARSLPHAIRARRTNPACIARATQ